jgi:putative FmdB family regulatory protein
MPTYEYLCSSCGNQWEEIQKISEPALEVCPKCSKSTAKRQISGGNFILKGGGWYADLYSSPKPASKSDDGGGSSEAKAKDSAGGDSKSKESSAPDKGTKTEKTEKAAPQASSGSSSSSGSSGSGGSSGDAK